MTTATLHIYQDTRTGGFQLTIDDAAEGGYRIMGPKFTNVSRLLLSKNLTARDAQEIRDYLNRAFPRSKK